MKTTVEINDELLEQAKALAARDDVTLRALIEQGLRQVLKQRQDQKPFRLRDASVGGGGLTKEFENATWDDYLKAIYGDRGG